MGMERRVKESERYWKAVKEIKKRRSKAVLLFLCFVFIVAYMAKDTSYRRDKKEMYEEKAAAIEQVMAREKEWIHANTGENGELYLNTTNGAKDVNPYFACQAAIGLLAGSPKEADFHVTAAYLNWHSRQLIEHEGIVSNYYTENGELLPSGEYDSVDSYIALYLTLLHTYVKEGGSLDSLTDWQEAVAICAGELEELAADGLTQVSERNAVSYLMDNVEVWEACKGMAEFLTLEDSYIKDWEGAAELCAFFTEQEQQIAEAVRSRFWNENEKRYEVGLDGSGRVLKFQGWEEFYPSAVAQIYPLAVGIGSEKDRVLYETLCETFSWEYLDIAGAAFEWPVVAYVGAVCGDEDRPEIYIMEYAEKYWQNRKYPLHTASSGWVLRACEQMLELYEERADGGLLKDLYRGKGIGQWSRVKRHRNG